MAHYGNPKSHSIASQGAEHQKGLEFKVSIIPSKLTLPYKVPAEITTIAQPSEINKTIDVGKIFVDSAYNLFSKAEDVSNHNQFLFINSLFYLSSSQNYLYNEKLLKSMLFLIVSTYKKWREIDYRKWSNSDKIMAFVVYTYLTYAFGPEFRDILIVQFPELYELHKRLEKLNRNIYSFEPFRKYVEHNEFVPFVYMPYLYALYDPRHIREIYILKDLDIPLIQWLLKIYNGYRLSEEELALAILSLALYDKYLKGSSEYTSILPNLLNQFNRLGAEFYFMTDLINFYEKTDKVELRTLFEKEGYDMANMGKYVKIGRPERYSLENVFINDFDKREDGLRMVLPGILPPLSALDYVLFYNSPLKMPTAIKELIGIHKTFTDEIYVYTYYEEPEAMLWELKKSKKNVEGDYKKIIEIVQNALIDKKTGRLKYKGAKIRSVLQDIYTDYFFTEDKSKQKIFDNPKMAKKILEELSLEYPLLAHITDEQKDTVIDLLKNYYDYKLNLTYNIEYFSTNDYRYKDKEILPYGKFISKRYKNASSYEKSVLIYIISSILNSLKKESNTGNREPTQEDVKNILTYNLSLFALYPLILQKFIKIK